ncbi:inorganic phosphate transporter [bacterium]|nr:inorganic phosphate transporter [bacterium]
MDFLSSFLNTTDPNMIALAMMAVGFGIYMAWTIGANDVANAMATSVGSGTISHKQAVVIAGVFNFSGCVFAGGSVTETVRKGIVNTDLFMNDPNLLILGMVAALLAAALWLHGATLFGMPVSTTHSIVGAIVGFALLVYGVQAVNWDKVIQIVLSWVVSPLLGGLISYLMFSLIRRSILNAKDPVLSVKIWAPLFGALTIGIIAISMIFKGLKNLHIHVTTLQLWMITLGAALIGFITISIIVRRLNMEGRDVRKVERVFMILQLLTACYVAFAHGANDVANAIGPVAAVIATIQAGIVALEVPVPFWILFLGGAGILTGLLSYGYKVMQTVGKNITEITPTRGFSAEFAAATVVLIASKMGIPVSTTHTLVGAVLGVGFAQGFDALNFKVVRSIAFSWLITLPIAAILTAGIFLALRAIFGM